MATRKPNWRRMGQQAELRRAELGLTQDELIEQMSEHQRIGIETLRRVEAGDQQSYRSTTLAALSIALGWEADRLWHIAHNAQPAGDDARFTAIENRLARIEEKVDTYISRRRPRGGDQ